MEVLINFIIFFILLGGAFFIGSYVEKCHYKNLENREAALSMVPIITSDNIDSEDEILDMDLVAGSVVISLDYFKRFLAGLRNIVGGRIASYETLLDRGRREAVIRMKEKASEAGYNMILNMRFQTSAIGQVTSQRGSLGCFEVMAYGTAIKMKIRL